MGKVNRYTVIKITSPVLMVSLWEFVTRSGLINPLFLPPPSMIYKSIVTAFISEGMTHNVMVSLKRLIIGYSLGIGTALICAMGMSLLSFNRWFFYPIISATYPIPKSAFYPLLVIWLGPTDLSKILLVAIAAFFPMVINTLTGLKEVPGVLIRAARNLGAGPLQIFFRVALPAALPAAYAGATLGASVSLIMLVYSEMTAAEAGIGYYMYDAASLMNTESAFAGVVILAVIGFFWYQGILWIQKVHCPWRQKIR